jgi:hypothetical protein
MIRSRLACAAASVRRPRPAWALALLAAVPAACMVDRTGLGTTDAIDGAQTDGIEGHGDAAGDGPRDASDGGDALPAGGNSGSGGFTLGTGGSGFGGELGAGGVTGAGGTGAGGVAGTGAGGTGFGGSSVGGSGFGGTSMGGSGFGGASVGGTPGFGGSGMGGSGFGGTSVGGSGVGGSSMGGSGFGGASMGGTPGFGGSGMGGTGFGGSSVGGSGVGGSSVGGSGVGGSGVGGAGTGGAGMGGSGVGGAPGVGGTGGTGGCNSFTCPTGCCTASQVCVTMPTTQQCGKGGGMCQTCGTCEICSAAGTCDVDPASQWDITAVSAMLTSVDPNDTPPTTAWDFGNQQYNGPLPDPFCQLEIPLGTFIGRTSIVIDTLAPMWNARINGSTPVAARDLLAGGKNWQIWVGDADSASSGEEACEINAPMDPAAFKSGTLTLGKSAGCLSVNLKLTCR